MIIDFIDILVRHRHTLIETTGFKYDLHTGRVKIGKKIKTQYITVGDMKDFKRLYPQAS
jgi:hypothetical protein